MPVLAAALLLAVAAPVPKEEKKAPPYPVVVGTKWEYTHDGNVKAVSSEEVTEAEEKDGVVTIRVDVKLPDGAKTAERFEVKGGEVWCLVSGGKKCDPPMLLCKAGVKEGDTWKSEYKIGRDGVKETVTVGKAEEITTPAGTFTAVPLVHTVQTLGAANYTTWFADGVGLVRHTSEGEKHPSQELKSFTPGGHKK
jgi:hypothetical protein